MSRTAIVLILAAALAAVSLGTYLLLFPRVREIQLAEASAGLSASSRALLEMERADQARLLARLTELAARPGLVQLMTEAPANGAGREAWLMKLRAEVAGLSAAAHKAATLKDLFVLDAKGKGLVRNVDLHWTDRAASTNPGVLAAIGRAEQGQPSALVFVDKGQLVREVSVPIVHKGRVLGILLAVFPLDRALARARTGELPQGIRVAYLSTDLVSTCTMAEAERTALKERLKRDPRLRTAVLTGQRVAPERIVLAGQAFLVTGLTGDVADSTSAGNDRGADPWGLLVFRSIQDLDRPIKELGLYLFGGTGLLLMFLIVLTVLLGGRLTRCLKDLERDMLDIVHTGERRAIHGRGPIIVRSLGVLASQLSTGAAFERAEPETEGGDDANDDVPTTCDDPPVPPDADPFGEYYRELFERFLAAKQDLGERPGKLGFERFRAKLEKQARKIQAKHGCADVRFEVKIKAGKVSLIPTIVA